MKIDISVKGNKIFIIPEKGHLLIAEQIVWGQSILLSYHLIKMLLPDYYDEMIKCLISYKENKKFNYIKMEKDIMKINEIFSECYSKQQLINSLFGKRMYLEES